MSNPNDLIFYGSGLYEIRSETETQYCLRDYFGLADSRLIFGWVDKNAPGIGRRIAGDDWSARQLAMIEVCNASG